MARGIGGDEPSRRNARLGDPELTKRALADWGWRTIGVGETEARAIVDTLDTMLVCRDAYTLEDLTEKDNALLGAVEDTIQTHRKFIPTLQQKGFEVWLNYTARRLLDTV